MSGLLATKNGVISGILLLEIWARGPNAYFDVLKQQMPKLTVEGRIQLLFNVVCGFWGIRPMGN